MDTLRACGAREQSIPGTSIRKRKLDGQCAIVTGANSGVASAICACIGGGVPGSLSTS
jgi:hypothetical protein